MAEALAVIGLVSSIVQFVDFGSKIINRLNEYRAAGNNIPKTFRNITIDLPLIINNLERTKQKADAHEINNETASVLLPVVEACLARTKELEELLDKALPVEGSSTWHRSKKAILSLANDNAVKAIMSDLKSYLQTLAHSQILSCSSPSSPTATCQRMISLQPNTQSMYQPCFMVDFAREENFVGRKDVINEIEKRFSDGHPCVAISGVSGVGKSQIAIEYCYRYKKCRPGVHVFWVYASNRARLTEAYQKIGKELGLPNVDDPDVDTLQLVRDWLSNDENGPWLLVVDNADDIETFFDSTDSESLEVDKISRPLFRYLPESSNGSMIITTRDKRVGQRLAKSKKPIEVLPFPIEDARDLLRKTLQDNFQDDNHSTTLLEALDFLPMAICQAAAFIRENDITVHEYLGYIRDSDREAKDLLASTYHDPGRDPESHNSVFQTAKISFECIRRQKPRVAEILSLMAVLDRQAIHNRLLRTDDERDLDFATAIGTLKAFSLITEERTKGMFGMHRLMQLSAQRWLEVDGMLEVWQRRAIDTVSRLCTADYAFTGEWKIWDSIKPQAEVVLSFDFQNEPCYLQRAMLLHRVAIYEFEQGNIPNADVRAREALATIEKVNGDHPKKLAIATTAACTLMCQGKFKEAEKMLRFVLEQRERTLGPSHPDTLVVITDLASALISQGKNDEGEALLQQGIEKWEHSPGVETHHLRFSIHTALGVNLKQQGKYEDAEVIMKRAVEGDRNVLGAKHPNTIGRSFCLAHNLMAQYKFCEAETLIRECVKDVESSLGSYHSHFFHWLGMLAYNLEQQGIFEEAEILRRRAWSGFEKSLGVDHQDTMVALAYLVWLLARLTRFDEMEPLLQRVLCWSQKNSTTENPTSIAMLDCLACALELQNKCEESEVLRRRVLLISENIHGLEYKDTIQAHLKLAVVLDWQNKHDEAVSYLKQALHTCEDRDPLALITLDVLDLLSTILLKQSKFEEAEILALRAFHGYEILYGSTHPYTVCCSGHVAMMMLAQGKYEAIAATYRPLLSGYQEALGNEHKSLKGLLYTIGESLVRLDRFDEAEPLCKQASKTCEEILGIENSLTLTCLHLLASIWERQQKFRAAVAVRRRVMRVQETILGLEHAETATSMCYLGWTLYDLMQYNQSLVLCERSFAILQRTLGPDHSMTLACGKTIPMMRKSVRYRRILSPQYFPRLRRLIRFATAPKRVGQSIHDNSHQMSTR